MILSIWQLVEINGALLPVRLGKKKILVHAEYTHMLGLMFRFNGETLLNEDSQGPCFLLRALLPWKYVQIKDYSTLK